MGQALTRAVPPGLIPPLSRDMEFEEESSHLLTVMDQSDQINQEESQTPENREEEEQKFPDLSHLPPEVALQVLKNLNATDLCLASCVWQQLASDNILWQGLCR